MIDIRRIVADMPMIVPPKIPLLIDVVIRDTALNRLVIHIARQYSPPPMPESLCTVFPPGFAEGS